MKSGNNEIESYIAEKITMLDKKLHLRDIKVALWYIKSQLWETKLLARQDIKMR